MNDDTRLVFKTESSQCPETIQTNKFIYSLQEPCKSLSCCENPNQQQHFGSVKSTGAGPGVQLSKKLNDVLPFPRILLPCLLLGRDNTLVAAAGQNITYLVRSQSLRKVLKLSGCTHHCREVAV